MTTEFPYEIWLHILSFLDTKTIRQLRFVNTLLYNLSLDDYHRITQIGYPHPFTDNAPLLCVISGINLNLVQLSLNHRDPGNAKRARILIIRRGPIYPRKYKPSRSRLGPRWPTWKSIKAKFSQMRCRIVGHEPETLLDKLLNAVPGLTTLTTLDISLPYSLDDHPFYWTKLDVIKAGWPIFAANLTNLHLDVPLEEIHVVLLSHIMLLRLEIFSIILRTLPTSEPNELIRKSLLPFLIDHGPTLRSLTLVARENMNISSMLNSLQHMPYLSDLNITHLFFSPEFTASLVGYRHFLEAHQSQIQHLAFNFAARSPFFNIDSSEFLNQEWCRVPLPGLQSLLFGLSGFRVSCGAAAIPYIQRHIPTVTSLTIRSLHFSYDQVASILTGPKSGGYQLTALRALDIEIWCFSPAFLSLLVDRAPQLRSLRLNASVIGPDKQPERFGRNRVPEVGLHSPSSMYLPQIIIICITVL